MRSAAARTYVHEDVRVVDFQLLRLLQVGQRLVVVFLAFVAQCQVYQDRHRLWVVL